MKVREWEMDVGRQALLDTSCAATDLSATRAFDSWFLNVDMTDAFMSYTKPNGES